ncbi:MAG: hypothetical protein K5924_03730 [Chloroflexi bacterium]|nr:hypothetical protein [Chloroflexota bacterium]
MPEERRRNHHPPGSRLGCWAGVILLAAIAGCGSAPTTEDASTRTPATPTLAVSAPSLPPSPTDPLALCEVIDPEEPVLELSIEAQSFAFDTEVIDGIRHCQPFAIQFTNLDRPSGSITHEHNIFIRLDNVLGTLVYEGETIGTGDIRYEVPGLPAGTHYFYCSLHAGVMNGDLLVEDA